MSSYIAQITEKRSNLVQILIAAVLIALITNIMGNLVYGYLQNIITVYGITITLIVIVLSIIVIAIAVLVFAEIYLGEEGYKIFSMKLLVNKESGFVMPVGYEPAETATLILMNYIKRNGKEFFLDVDCQI